MKALLFFTFIFLSFSGYTQTAAVKSTSGKTPATAKKNLSADFFGFPGVRQSTTGIKPNEITIIAPNGDVMRFVTIGKFFTFQLKKEAEVVKNIRKKIPESKKQKDALVKTAISKKGPAYYSLTKQIVDEHDAVDKAYESVTTNRINLNDPLQRRKDENATVVPDEAPATPDWIKKKFQEISDYAKSIEGSTLFDLPKPPAIDLACNLCQKDSAARQHSEDVRKKYSEQLFKKENDALENSFRIYRAYHLALGEPASMKTMMKELQDARTIIFKQVFAKCQKLLDEYGNDLEALLYIIPIVLQKERERQLIDAGREEKDDTKIMEKVAVLFSHAAIQSFIDKKLASKDFRYIINPAPLISLSRQCMLLGGMDENEYQELVAKIIDNNRFEYQSTIEIKRTFAGKDGDHSMEAVFVSEPFFYMVAETRDCRLVLIPDTGFQTVYSKNRLIDYTIRSIRNTECTYSGPKQLQMPSPVIHLDFCADTARLEYTFDTDWTGYKEKWSCSYGGDEDLIKNLLSEGYYNRVDDREEQMEELTNNDKAEGFEQMHSGKDPPVNNLEEMKKQYPKAIETGQKSFDFRKFIIRVPLVNFQPTLIQEKLDGRQTHDADDERFEYAWLRIRLDHAPKISSK